jgi:hypothetical protein
MSRASDAQKARWAAWKKMKREQNSSFRDFVDKNQQRNQRAAWCDASRDRLLILGEVWDEHLQVVRKASTIEEERQSAMQFAQALKMESPIMEGTTLRDLLRRVFYEYYRVGQPLLNPITNKFTEEWEKQPATELPRFEDRWEFLDPPSAYDAPLLPVPVTAPKTAEQKFNEWARDNGKAPTAFFSSRVMPYAGDE